MSVTKIAAPNQRNPLNIGMSLRKASLPQDPTLHYSTIPPPRFLSSYRACLRHAEVEHKHAEDTGHAHRGCSHGRAEQRRQNSDQKTAEKQQHLGRSEEHT